jgi:ferric-dicitrate binding protein FerR (iron transport regulator)
MIPDYAAYTTTDFLDDATFIRWVKGDTTAAAFWDGWLATNPPNADAARAARQQLRLLLAAEPVAVGAHTLRFIWQDITQSVAEHEARARRRTWQWASAAAAALAGVAVGGWLLTRPAPATMYVDATPYGQTRQLTLPDGTRVTLNAHSRLRRYAWRPGAAREVWLQGEAYFDVQHLDRDNLIVPGERFIVHTGQLNVEVLGTRFNVKQRRAQTQVVLQRGRVRVSLPGRPALTLAPSEAARFDSVSGRFDKLVVATTAPTLAWTEQKLLLHRTTVNDILQTVEDTYGYRTVLADPRLGQRELEGVLPLRDEKSVLFVLGAILHVPVTKRDSTIYIGAAAR